MSATLRLHLGGSKHGQVLLVTDNQFDVRYSVPQPLTHAELVQGGWFDRRFTTEVYTRERLALFGGTLTVMVSTEHLEDSEWFRKAAREFLISSLAKVLMNGE